MDWEFSNQPSREPMPIGAHRRTGPVPGCGPPACNGLAVVAVAIVVVAICQTTARADGKYFPLIGAEAEPTIPFQRAVIAYRDGSETMIVESAVQNGGGEVGWVVPLPAVPEEVTACKPGVLTSVYQLVGPTIVSSLGTALSASALWFWGLLLVCLWIAQDRAYPNVSRGFRVARTAVAAVALLVVAAWWLSPTLSRSRLIPAGGVRLLQHHRAGSYDVDVVTGQSGQAVRAWLTGNGFGVSPEAASVLDDYARRGWCFAAARIRADGDETIVPHPLKFVFRTSQAVYPMQLTGVGAQRMRLDLYVIGEQPAAHPHLDRWSCDRYRPVRNSPSEGPFWRLADGCNLTVGETYEAESIGIAVGHPDITALMWPACTLSHLRDTLNPTEMAQDFIIRWERAEPHRVSVYTPESAAELGHVSARVAGGLGVTMVTLVWVRSNRRRSRRLVWALIGGVLLVAVCFVGVGRLVPTVETQSFGTGRFGARLRTDAYAELLEEPWSATDSADFPTLWAQSLDRLPVSSRFGPLEFAAIDVPGGYEIAPAPGGWTLTLYDGHATPTRVPIGPDGRPVPELPPPTQPAP